VREPGFVAFVTPRSPWPIEGERIRATLHHPLDLSPVAGPPPPA
jgi:hypothetical protein